MNESEGRLQQEIFTKHWNQYPDQRRLLFAVNNNSINRVKGAQMKSIGVVSGVSDLIFINPRTGSVQFLEIKLEKGRQSDNQIDFEQKVIRLGYKYYLIRSIEDFNKATTLNIR